MKFRGIGAVLALSMTASIAYVGSAAAQQAEEEGPWSGSVSLGYLATSGNTDNSNVNAGVKVAYAQDSWLHQFEASAIGATENEQTTAEAYKAGFKSEYSFNDTDYMFGLLEWQKDNFSGVRQQVRELVGYGRRILNTDVHTLNAELSVGARQSELQDGTDENETVVRVGGDYEFRLSDTASFRQVLAVERGSENTYLESVSELRAQIVGTVALVASYTIKRNSEVPVGAEKTDTFTALSLEYAF